jgi:hypothetical protein
MSDFLCSDLIRVDNIVCIVLEIKKYPDDSVNIRVLSPEGHKIISTNWLGEYDHFVSTLETC